MADTSFDVIVIGAGPGGYVCAIRAAQLGLSVACVEKRETLGGTCLNVGCIPSKALLTASEKFAEAGHGLAKMGVKVAGVELDLPRMLAFKDEVVAANVKGVEFLFKKNKIAWIKGAAKLTAANTVSVTGAEGTQELKAAKAVVIATGSDSAALPGLTIDEKTILTSTGALTLDTVPERLVVVGAGVIGLELGSVWARLGSKVTVVEYLDRILPAMDGELAKTMQRILSRQGLTFRLATKVTGAKPGDAETVLTLEPAKGGEPEDLTADAVLVAIGRRPYTDGLGLDEAGVTRDKAGRITVDGHFQSSVPGVYAIGDVIEGPMLAHKAEDEGMALAEHLAGQAGHVNREVIPGVVYTWPEAASVGKTEEELKAAGIAYKTGKFPFTANGRARAIAMTDGFVKVLADAATDRVLGVHAIGPNVGEMIQEVCVAMEFAASAEDIARTCHAHPTLSEALKEAALAADGRAIHA
jgi:dihydrolipoamide dehydrogenase